MLAAVIGWPVEHSRSPAIHNAAAQAVGVDLVYVALAVRPGQGAAAAAAMRTLGVRGMSVTMPHKADVIAALDELTPQAETLGAVNHITNTDGHLAGNNTDGPGFVLGLQRDAAVDVSEKRVGVFGAGGAARAVVAGCADSGADVVVVARDPTKAAKAASVAPGRATADTIDAFGECDVVVNATPIGMAGFKADVSVPFDVSALKDGTVVVDIVYKPLETPLLTAARTRGLPTVDGLSMLVGQAAAQFESWTGVEAPYDAMRAAARG